MSETETENRRRSSEQKSKKNEQQEQEQEQNQQNQQQQNSESLDSQKNKSEDTNPTGTMDKLLNKVPNMSPEGPLGTQTKGPLSPLGDPLGQVLNYTLAPLGHVTSAIGNPHGEALSRVQRVAQHEGVFAAGEPKYLPDCDNGKPDAELPGGERMGGKEQTGENPLGL